MRQRLYTYIITLLLAGFTFGFLVYQSISSIQTQVIPTEAMQGKQIFQHKACIECHTIFGMGGYWGGDLTKAYDSYGDSRITEYLTKAPVLGGAKHKRHEKLSAAEAKQVIAYLKFINSINTLDWPPHRNTQDYRLE